MVTKTYLVILFMLLVFSPFTFAQNGEEDLDDMLSGFDEKTSEKSVPAQPSEEKKSYALIRRIGLFTTYNIDHGTPKPGETDYRGLSRLRPRIDLDINWKISPTWKFFTQMSIYHDAVYSLKGRDNYRDEVLDALELRYFVGEGWIQGSLTPALDVKLGNQVVVWGKSDTLQITDRINPMDNQEPGLVDIKDMRIAIPMLKFDYYQAGWHYSLILPAYLNPQNPPQGSDFFPSNLPFPPGYTLPKTEIVATDDSNFPIGFSLSQQFTGWDLALYAARILDNRWHFASNRSKRIYDMITMAGFASSISLHSFVLKMESVRLQGLSYNTISQEKNRWDSLIGFDYNGWTDASITLEGALRKTLDFDSKLKSPPDFVKENQVQSALRFSRLFLRQALKANYVISLLGPEFEEGGFQRLWMSYQWPSTVTGTWGVVDYIGGENPLFEGLKHNDRLFLDITYHF